MQYLRIQDGVAVELISLAAGVTPADALHPSLAAACVLRPVGVEVGEAYANGAFQGAAAPIPTKDDLVARARTARFALETAGIEVGGHTIRTDRESQALIAGARVLAEVEPNEPVDFQTATGWEAMDSASVIVLALEVGRHVRACFRKGRTVEEAIVAGTITTFAQIDEAFAAA